MTSKSNEEEEEDRFEIGFKIKNGKQEFQFGFKSDEPLDVLEEIDEALNPEIDQGGE